jgi:hypothetical protein
VQHFQIGFGETAGEKVRLLLVVAFEADPISGPDYRLQQRGRVVWRHHLSRCEFAPRRETFVAGSPLTLPISHVVQLLLIITDLSLDGLVRDLDRGLAARRCNKTATILPPVGPIARRLLAQRELRQDLRAIKI